MSPPPRVSGSTPRDVDGRQFLSSLGHPPAVLERLVRDHDPEMRIRAFGAATQKRHTARIGCIQRAIEPMEDLVEASFSLDATASLSET
jgi:hypothetical protein